MDLRFDSKTVVALQRTTPLIQQGQGQGQGLQRVTIGSLPGDVLLVIFESYQVVPEGNLKFPWNWKALVHVCQQWRYLIFESPNRLDLQLCCTVRAPVRKSLDVWPPLPLFVQFLNWECWGDPDNIVAALEQHDRVCQIYITALDNIWEEIVTVMQKPFPALKSLTLRANIDPYHDLVFPDTFLDGSAPSLQNLLLQGISFLSLPRLLSSTSDLTSLHLFHIPYSGYIPPEEMAISLSALPKLKSLIITFKPSIRLRLKEILRHSPPPWPPATRFGLPVLTQFVFEGVSEDLEILAARIDAPLLDDFQITFFHLWAEIGLDNPDTGFLTDIPQTIRFCGLLDSFRPSSLTLKFEPASISFPSNTTCHSAIPSSWHIDCQRLDWQIISVARICSQILPLCSRIKSLNIKHWPGRPVEPEIDSVLWLQLFRTFPSVERLEISSILESSISPVLQGLTGESAADVFPSLQSVSIVKNEMAPPKGIARAAGPQEQPPQVTSGRFLKFISQLTGLSL